MSWRDDLLAEKSLWQIYRGSPRFWTTRSNAVIVSATAICLTAFAALHFHPPAWAAFLGRYSLYDTMLAWAGQGFTYAATMLAFLIAGFTVFSTITRPGLFVELAQIPHNGGPLSELKFVFFVFFNVFVHYLAFIMLCATVVFLGGKDGPLVLLGEVIKAWTSTTFFDVLQHAVFVGIGTWFVLLLLKLKSFIYNLYAMVMLVIVNEGKTETPDQPKPK
jgi:hypothetical protein